jgi:Zn-dependent oligopeptidase
MSTGTGWMLGLRGRNLAAPDGGLPLAALVFNFQSPSSDVPCCLSFPDMVQLFQKVNY